MTTMKHNLIMRIILASCLALAASDAFAKTRSCNATFKIIIDRDASDSIFNDRLFLYEWSIPFSAKGSHIFSVIARHKARDKIRKCIDNRVRHWSTPGKDLPACNGVGGFDSFPLSTFVYFMIDPGIFKPRQVNDGTFLGHAELKITGDRGCKYFQRFPEPTPDDFTKSDYLAWDHLGNIWSTRPYY